jgi:hypothetical protein
MKAKQFTPEQEKALADFELACTSHDLHAFGHGRKFRACEALALAHTEVEKLGVADALTSNELAAVNRAKAFIS